MIGKPNSSTGFGVVQPGADYPVWHAVPPLTETFAAIATLVGALLDGSLPPEDFAAALQAAIDACRTCQTTV